MSDCKSYVSEEDIKALKESEIHIENVARSRNLAGEKVLSVTDTIRGEKVTNRTLDGLEELYQNALSNIGYQQMGDYKPGITIDGRNQIVFENGSWFIYRGDLPHVTAGATLNEDGGIWSEENPNGQWVNVGQQSLREELNSNKGVSMIGTYPNGNLKQAVNWVTLEQFGADPTGETNSLKSIQDAFIYAGEHGFKVVQSSGVFKLSGDGDILIKTDTFLSGSVFIPDNWNGSFTVNRDSKWVDYDTNSDVVKKMIASGLISKGECNIPSMDGDETLDNSLVIINSNQEMYYYRDKIRYRKEINHFISKGQVMCPFYYDFDPVSIIKLSSLKIADSYLTVDGISIDESLQNTGIPFVQIHDCTKVVLSNVSFHNLSKFKENPSDRVSVNRSAYIYINDMQCSESNISSSGGSIYSMYIGESLDVNVSGMISEGYGWGVIGANDVRRINFEKSSISRIDFHNPAQEYLKITDCNIGNWGVLISIMGDLHLNRVNFIQRNAYNNSGFIRLRPDCGAWCDGNLYINDVSIGGHYIDSVAKNGLVHSSNTNTNKDLPDSSPISNTIFKKILARNITLNDGYSVSDFRLFNSTGNPKVLAPEVVSVFNLYTSGVISVNATFLNEKSNTKININDSEMEEFYIKSSEGGMSVQASFDNVTSSSGHGVVFYLQSKGDYYLSNCEIKQLNGYSRGWNLDRSVLMDGNRILATESANFLRLTNIGSVITRNNKIIMSEESLGLLQSGLSSVIGYSEFYNNKIYVNNKPILGIKTTTSFNLVNGVSTRFQVLIKTNDGISKFIDVFYDNQDANYDNLVTISKQIEIPIVQFTNNVTEAYII